jgi:hypothetical protein
LALALLASACSPRPRPCAPSRPARLELRDGAGALQLALKDSVGGAGASDLCDAAAARVGVISVEAGTVTLFDRAGRLALRLRRLPGDDPVGDGPTGARLRIHEERGETRVLAPDGVAFGSVTGADGSALVFDKGGRPIASVKPRGADQLIADSDGATRAYVIPAASARAAAAFALPGLSAAEGLALYLFFARP